MEYSPGRNFSEMDLAKELGTPRSKVREAFSLLAQEKLVQIIPQRCTTICKLDLVSILDSIFIIRSILIAVAKDVNPQHLEKEPTITQLRESLLSLESEARFTDEAFFKADHHFHLVISKLNGFPRLNKIISKEKINIDRTLRLSIGRRSDYISIARLYGNVLSGILGGAPDKSIKALCEIASLLEKYAHIAVKYHPTLFR